MDFTKIKCPNCNTIHKGTLLEHNHDANGVFRTKCRQCNAFIVIELKNGEIVNETVENKSK